jgi:recombination protein RecA
MDSKDKRAIIDKYLKSTRKKLGENVDIGIASEMDLDYDFMVPPIPSLATLMGRDDGSPGGFPYGKVTVIAGPEKSGKTTLCIQTLASEMVNNEDNYYVWVDTENSFDAPYAKKLGIDFDRLIFIRNGIMHDVLNRIIELAKTDIINGVFVDSVGGLTPKEEIEDSRGNEHGLEKDHMLNLQRKMGQFLRMINPFVGKRNIPVILIAHVYQDPGMNGAYRVKGGNALKHWGHVRLMVSRVNDQSTKQQVIMPDGNKKEIFTGHDVVIKLDKTRQNSKESQTVVVPYRYGIGLDAFESAISVAINFGIIKGTGAWFTYDDQKFQGRKKVLEFFRSNKEAYDKLIHDITVVNETEKEEEVQEEIEDDEFEA